MVENWPRWEKPSFLTILLRSNFTQPVFFVGETGKEGYPTGQPHGRTVASFGWQLNRSIFRVDEKGLATRSLVTQTLCYE